MRKTNSTNTNNQMVQEADNFIAELGLSDEILGLRTKQDKILYYHNYIDPKNMFRGVLEFHNPYFIRLSNFLCNDEKRLIEFGNFYKENIDKDVLDVGNNARCMWSYRCHVISNRTSQEEQLVKSTIINSIDNKDWTGLHDALQELFLNVIDIGVLNRIIGMIENGLTAEDLYKWYKLRKNLASITTFDIDYVKAKVA